MGNLTRLQPIPFPGLKSDEVGGMAVGVVGRTGTNRGLASVAVTVVCLVTSGFLSSPLSADTRDPIDAGPHDVVDMTPDTPPSWSFRYLGAPVIALFRGTDYVYAPRRVGIETTPADGYLDLFYVRSGFQKRFEQSESPVTVILPSRLEAGPRDAFTVRAFADGYRPKSVTIRLADRFGDVKIDLEPLPNRLEVVSHRYFAGRSSIDLLTPEALTFRVQQAEDGYALILNETSLGDSARASVESIRSPLIEEAYSQQLGSDLMIKLVLVDPSSRDSVEVRSRQGYDAPRDLHEFSLDLMPAESGATSIATALDALAALSTKDVTGCRMEFDDALRAELDAGDLSRALRPRGAFTDRYLRAAMRRLGEVSVDGVVDFVDGTQLRPEDAIELEMAIANAATAKGYLALLDAFVARLEADAGNRTTALQTLLAPESPTNRFESHLKRARDVAGECDARM